MFSFPARVCIISSCSESTPPSLNRHRTGTNRCNAPIRFIFLIACFIWPPPQYATVVSALRRRHCCCPSIYHSWNIKIKSGHKNWTQSPQTGFLCKPNDNTIVYKKERGTVPWRHVHWIIQRHEFYVWLHPSAKESGFRSLCKPIEMIAATFHCYRIVRCCTAEIRRAHVVVLHKSINICFWGGFFSPFSFELTVSTSSIKIFELSGPFTQTSESWLCFQLHSYVLYLVGRYQRVNVKKPFTVFTF